MKLEELKLQSPSKLVSGLILGLNLSMLGCIEERQPVFEFNEVSINTSDMDKLNRIELVDDFEERTDYQKSYECLELNPVNGYCLSTCDNHEIIERSSLVNQIIFDEESRYSDVYENFGRILVGCFDLCAARHVKLEVALDENVNFEAFRAPNIRFLRNGWSIDEIVTGGRYNENLIEGTCVRYKVQAQGSSEDYVGFLKGKESINSTIIVDNYESRDSRRLMRRSIVFEKNMNHFYYQFLNNDTHSINLTISTTEANKTNTPAQIFATCNTDALVEVINSGNTNFVQVPSSQRYEIFNQTLDFFETFNIQIKGNNEYRGVRPNCKIEINGNGNTFSQDDQSQIYEQNTFDM